MSDRYRLGALGNEQLVAALFGLVRREHDLMSDLLAHLAELDERRLYLDLGYSSLFAYCTEALGFCRSSAGRRIAVARVCRKYPEAFARVARGELQLSVLSLLAQHLNRENAAALFAESSGKSCEQVEVLLAVRFPKPDVRDLIRRLPVRSPFGTPDGGSAEAGSLRVAAGGESSVSSEVVGRLAAAQSAGPAQPTQPAQVAQLARPELPARRLEPLSADRFGVHFTADAEFRGLLEEVRALASHRQPRGELMPLLKLALQAYRRELLKVRFGVGRKARRSGTVKACEARAARSRVEANLHEESKANGGANGHEEPNAHGRANSHEEPNTHGDAKADARANAHKEPSADARVNAHEEARADRRSRRVPAAVARAVYARDGGRCTFCSGGGRRCEAREFLELDHVTPWAVGGESLVDNLRVRCRAHNLQAARGWFGDRHVQAAIRRAQLEAVGASSGAG
jgi:5-methylcytosine-specific restriction endonuclease McrA